MLRFLSILTLAMLMAGNIFPCTTVIISGKNTPDGRPIIWKHRDTDNLDNKLVHFKGAKYSAIGLVNSNDEKVENVWMGFNNAGFVIMNSASFNLKGSDTTKIADLEGVLMKAALLQCASVSDFEQFLLNYSKPLGVEANFGVIDAYGGAAYFETNNFSFIKIDVNDKRVAPNGYVVRTNFSYTGEGNVGYGFIRFETAEKLFYRASGSGNLSVPYMLENMCLSLENTYSNQKLSDYVTLSESQQNFMYFNDCINRFTSSASVIVQGVKQGEPAEFTTMWAMVGFPLASVPVPVWLTPKGSLPTVITAKGGENAEICNFALELKKRMVPSRRGSTKNYINTTTLANAQGTGIMQQLSPVRLQMVSKANERLEQWRRSGKLNQAEVDAFYTYTDGVIRDTYAKLIGVK